VRVPWGMGICYEGTIRVSILGYYGTRVLWGYSLRGYSGGFQYEGTIGAFGMRVLWVPCYEGTIGVIGTRVLKRTLPYSNRL
jgi:hypothetical protein